MKLLISEFSTTVLEIIGASAVVLFIDVVFGVLSGTNTPMFQTIGAVINSLMGG